MRHRIMTTALIALLTLGAAGCGPAGHQVGEIPEPDTPTPDTTPLLEPVTPPAQGVDRPDEEPGSEGGVPEDDPLGSEDGEESGIGDEPDEPAGQEDEDF